MRKVDELVSDFEFECKKYLSSANRLISKYNRVISFRETCDSKGIDSNELFRKAISGLNEQLRTKVQEENILDERVMSTLADTNYFERLVNDTKTFLLYDIERLVDFKTSIDKLHNKIQKKNKKLDNNQTLSINSLIDDLNKTFSGIKFDHRIGLKKVIESIYLRDVVKDLSIIIPECVNKEYND